MADFRPFSPCWGDISFTEDVSQVVGCRAGAVFLSWRPAGSGGGIRGVCRRGRGTYARVRARPSEHSHAIRLGEVSTKPENVAIPTIEFQDLKGSWGNCMRNWVWAQECGKRPLDTSPAGWRGPGCDARGRRQGLARQHTDTPTDWRSPRGLRGLAAVPVGGGRARAGLEIDHSEPSGSRVAISRAGRRPPAHTAARPIKARPRGGRRSVGATNNKQKDRRPPAHAAAGPAGQRARRLERQRRHTQHPHNRPGTPKGRVPKYPPLVGSLSHCLVEA